MNRFKVSGTSSLVAFTLIASMSLVGTGALVWERLQGNDVNKDMKLSLETFSLLKIDKAKYGLMPETGGAGVSAPNVKTGREDDLKKMK